MVWSYKLIELGNVVVWASFFVSFRTYLVDSLSIYLPSTRDFWHSPLARKSRLNTCLDRHRRAHHQKKRTRCHLIPIREFYEDGVPFVSFLSERNSTCFDKFGRYYKKNGGDVQRTSYELGLAEENDLPVLSRFIVQSFGADAISLSMDMSELERMIMRPAIELVNGYSGIVAFAEVLAGLRSRLRYRLNQNRNENSEINIQSPHLHGLTRKEQISLASSTSIVLAVARATPADDTFHQIDIIATVELRLQPCDAKIPFSWPWLDRIERNIATLVRRNSTTTQEDLQPYLSNLCVDELHRGQGLGRALVRCVEDIAGRTWGYSRMYLHVDANNKAALALYKSEGYTDVGKRWNPFWAGKSADIGYFVKDIGSSTKFKRKKSERLLTKA